MRATCSRLTRSINCLYCWGIFLYIALIISDLLVNKQKIVYIWHLLSSKLGPHCTYKSDKNAFQNCVKPPRYSSEKKAGSAELSRFLKSPWVSEATTLKCLLTFDLQFGALWEAWIATTLFQIMLSGCFGLKCVLPVGLKSSIDFCRLGLERSYN